EAALQRGLRRWDHRRGFRRPARNLLREGLDPETYRDPAWSTDAYAPEKLYPAVVMHVDRNVVTARLNRDTITLPPTSFTWTQRPTMEGMLNRGDIISVRLDIDSKTKAERWLLDQVPAVEGAAVILDGKS